MVYLMVAVLIAVTASIHYSVLKPLSRLIDSDAHTAIKQVSIVVILFAAHTVEVFIYAVVYYYIELLPSFGGLENNSLRADGNALYLSLLAFSSLGFSDLKPYGDLRVLVGFEALNGLLLITWSASFTYLSMDKLWHVIREPKPNPQPSFFRRHGADRRSASRKRE